jgi:hypothetical protein
MLQHALLETADEPHPAVQPLRARLTGHPHQPSIRPAHDRDSDIRISYHLYADLPFPLPDTTFCLALLSDQPPHIAHHVEHDAGAEPTQLHQLPHVRQAPARRALPFLGIDDEQEAAAPGVGQLGACRPASSAHPTASSIWPFDTPDASLRFASQLSRSAGPMASVPPWESWRL